MDEDDINERIRQMASDGETQPIVSSAPVTDYLSGALQAGLALGTGYLSRRIDIDLQSRIAGSQPTVTKPSNQRPVNDHAAVAGGFSLPSMSSLMPWLLGGLVLVGVAAFAFKGR